ncbi:PAS domain-containing protein [Pedobacter sp. N36a]|uniref:PAS domain-containing protein n=1 Tax=Pedobacter sp. N36a TaxID=2767996 RepID=UPI001656BF22|nr:PAS domain-containing protein [Pedobacter sp. N36a]MBC8988072.1 PAS domain-containing protein [Pedobacter sp. N36a]
MITIDAITSIYNCIPTPSIILKTDAPRFTIAMLNAALLKIVNVEPSVLIGKGFFEAFPNHTDPMAPGTENLKYAFKHVLKFKESYQINEHLYSLPSLMDQKSINRCWKITTYPLLDINGEVDFIVLSSEDITNLKEIQDRSKRFNELESLEKNVLELNSKSDVLIEEVLYTYLKGIESLFPELYCALKELENAPSYRWVSPSLPQSFAEKFGGNGVCKELGSSEKVEILEQNELVDHYSSKRKDRSSPLLFQNLRAYRSQPIVKSDGKLRAIFFVYYSIVQEPSEEELYVIDRVMGFLKMIFENRERIDRLKETALIMDQTQKLANFCTWSWDIKKNEVTWSDAMFSIYGKLIKHTFEAYQEFLHPEDKEIVYNKIQAVIAVKGDTEFEQRMIRPDGQMRHLKSWVKVECEKGSPIKLIGASLDITESKKIENALKISNERYYYVNELTNDAIYDWDILNDHVEWGDAFFRMFGYRKFKENFPIARWAELVYPDETKKVVQELNFALKNTSEVRWIADYRLKKENGAFSFVEESGYILRNINGEAIRMIGVIRDVSERKASDIQRAQQELTIKHHLARYEAVFKATRDAIWDYDLMTKEVIWNKGIKEIFGHQRVEARYQWWYDHVHPDDIQLVNATVRSALRKGQSRWSCEYRFKCADGNYKFVLDSGVFIFGDTGEVIRMIGAMQDITERVNYIHTIEQHNARLQDIAWAQTHLVRAPLARILGLVPFLSTVDQNHDQHSQIISYLEDSAKELDEVIKNIIKKSNCRQVD